MAEIIKTSPNTAFVSSRQMVVRMQLHDGETLFSSSDILKACGIIATHKWLDSARKRWPEEFLEKKIVYPLEVNGKRRYVRMNFVDCNSAKRIIELVGALVTENIKKWLLDEVLTCEIEERNTRDVKRNAEFLQSIQNDDVYAINKRIDTILIELLEIKKKLTKDIA